MGFFENVRKGVKTVAKRAKSFISDIVSDTKEQRDRDEAEEILQEEEAEETFVDIKKIRIKGRSLKRIMAERILQFDASRGMSRGGGKLGDVSICAFLPYQNTIRLMERDETFKQAMINLLNSAYTEIRNKLYREIGNPNPSARDPTGVVPRDTGALRRSIRWSLSRNYAIVPDVNTPSDSVNMMMWIFANKEYARDVTEMARIKGYCKGPPAVQHPIRKCPRLNTSRHTGMQKFDPSADPDFFNMLVSSGRQAARSFYNRHPQLKQYFYLSTSGDIKI